ncbi:hypothetical protein LBMAG38_25090 [Chloroflexota bacterium]|nr:hypothetical protein LBMAG38_25090 [Chloroflexota bacterium]
MSAITSEYNPVGVASLSWEGRVLTGIPIPLRPMRTRPAATGYAFALAFCFVVEQSAGAQYPEFNAVCPLVY